HRLLQHLRRRDLQAASQTGRQLRAGQPVLGASGLRNRRLRTARDRLGGGLHLVDQTPPLQLTRPIPTFGGTAMLWLTWRQFRAQAIVAATALAVVAISLIATGFSVRDQYRAAGLPGCQAHQDCQHAASLYVLQLRASGPYDLFFN